MPWSDVWIVFQWWGTVFLVGAAAYPLTRRIFGVRPLQRSDPYVFSKAVGMAVVSWIVYVLGTIKILPFTQMTILIALGVVFAGGLVNKGHKGTKGDKGIILQEIFFFLALLFWSWVKAHEPSIRGLEKFMDFGFMQSVLNSRFFPPADIWYAGEPINYYYFGHLVTAVLTKFSGLDLSYTFNLMLATIFALTVTMSFSIGRKIGGGILTAFLVTMAGNMQTIYAFTRGYEGDHVAPFWTLGWTLEGLKTYWYANATRFIPFSIHEFPSYSFVVSDVHGHVLSIPFALLAIAMLIQKKISLLFYGFLVGVLLMTNALDGPIYLGLFVFLFWKHWKRIGIVAATAVVASLPFLLHFKSFVNGIAVNCPPTFLENTRLGPIIFETVDKCQRSPLWMMALLWGFFLYCGYWLFLTKNVNRVLKIFFLFALALILFPEFFYFKDIYPAHFRSNTMFKLGYQAFILFSIVSGYTIVKIKNKVFYLFLVPQLFLVSIYPIFSVRSYFNSLKNYEGIYGLSWLEREYPDDYKAILWLKTQKNTVLVEGDGDSYTDFNRFSAFTGMPTVVGWAVHEWLWRGSYDVVSPRREIVRLIYESDDIDLTRELLRKFNVGYIVVGTLERQKFAAIQEEKFSMLGQEAFRSNNAIIYRVLTPE